MQAIAVVGLDISGSRRRRAAPNLAEYFWVRSAQSKPGVLTRLPACKSQQSLQVREVRRDTVSCAVHVKRLPQLKGDRKATQ
jgi:hypothetical protein